MSGSQSPPLELTGEEKTLGVPATNKSEGAASVKADAGQRAGEFDVHRVCPQRARSHGMTHIGSQFAMELII